MGISVREPDTMSMEGPRPGIQYYIKLNHRGEVEISQSLYESSKRSLY